MSKSLQTKLNISEAFKTLATKTSIKKISIQDISKKCGINRQTFYYHFQDIYDLIYFILQENTLYQLEEEIRYDDWRQALVELFSFIENNKTLCLNIYEFLGYQRLLAYYEEKVKAIIMNMIKEEAKEGKITEEQISDIASFYASGIMDKVIGWIKSDLKEEPVHLANRLNLLITTGIKSAVEAFIQ